jgi:hypothetical protein
LKTRYSYWIATGFAPEEADVKAKEILKIITQKTTRIQLPPKGNIKLMGPHRYLPQGRNETSATSRIPKLYLRTLVRDERLIFDMYDLFIFLLFSGITHRKKLLVRNNQVFTYHNTEAYELGQVKFILITKRIALS